MNKTGYDQLQGLGKVVRNIGVLIDHQKCKQDWLRPGVNLIVVYIDGSRAVIVQVLTVVLPGGISETH